jgi:hypothetical protein
MSIEDCIAAPNSSKSIATLESLPVELWEEIVSYLTIKDFIAFISTHRRAAVLAQTPFIVARVYHNSWSVTALNILVHGNRCTASRVIDILFRISG